jgi:signal transduction histidine kinase
MRAEEPAPPAATTGESERGPADRSGAIPSISEVVARIERLRSSRQSSASERTGDPGEAPRLFRWECNDSGEIDWVDGAPRGALVGQSIAQRSGIGGVDRSVERAFASRAPFHDGLLELPPDASAGGSWKISGIPAFDRATGRFAGYRGVAERSQNGLTAIDPTSLRELAHEIKTPLNAIIGFAEIITGEYLGPAGGAYRQRADEIVAQARLLLSAIEDLDFAAKIHSTNGSRHSRVHLGELVERLVRRLRETAAERGVTLEASRTTADLTAAMDQEIAERLILRTCEAVISRASQGECLRLGVNQENSHCTVSISRPHSLAGASDEDLFGTADEALSEGFPLRLARGLAHSAGTEVKVSANAISLAFPRA